MRIYVASKFEEKERVQELYEWLLEAGHKITHDWTREDDSKAKPGKLDEYYARCAADDIDGVIHAEAAVLLPHERGKGLYVEFGAALALGIPVVVWQYDGELPECIFLKHPDVYAIVNDEKGVLEALRRIEAEETAVAS